MGRRTGADEIQDGQETGHRKVRRAVSALLSGLRSVGAGFPEGGKAKREAVLHEHQLQGPAHAFHARPDRHQALRVEGNLHASGELRRRERQALVAAGAHEPRSDRLSPMGERLRRHGAKLLRAHHRRRRRGGHDPRGARSGRASPRTRSSSLPPTTATTAARTASATKSSRTRKVRGRRLSSTIPRLPKQHAGKVCEAVTGNVDMTATIFALAGVPAPEGIDGKSLLPLLANPSGRVREWLPLFNFWGIQSAQSMAVVTPRVEIHLLVLRRRGMKPTEPIVQAGWRPLRNDTADGESRIRRPVECDAAVHTTPGAGRRSRRRLSRETATSTTPFSFLSRTIPWEQKAATTKKLNASSPEEEGQATNRPEKKRNANKEHSHETSHHHPEPHTPRSTALAARSSLGPRVEPNPRFA